MEFRYAMKADDKTDFFVEGVVLARQFLGDGPWHVWDMRVNSARLCKECSSQLQRVVCHDRDHRCPNVLNRAATGEARAVRAREAIANRAARQAKARAQDQGAEEEEGGAAAVEEQVAVEEEVAVEENDAAAAVGEESSEEARDDKVESRQDHRAHLPVLERLIADYRAKHSKEPSSSVWYNLHEQAKAEIASQRQGKRRRRTPAHLDGAFVRFPV